MPDGLVACVVTGPLLLDGAPISMSREHQRLREHSKPLKIWELRECVDNWVKLPVVAEHVVGSKWLQTSEMNVWSVAVNADADADLVGDDGDDDFVVVVVAAVVVLPLSPK